MTEDDKISLKSYVDQRFSDYDRAIRAAMDAAERASQRANEAADKRFESVNEFRNALSDQQRSLMSRSEYEQGHKNISDRVSSLEQFRFELGGGSKSTDQAITRGVAVLSLLVALFIAAEQYLRPH